MLELNAATIVLVFGLLQLAGWVGGVLTRCSVGSRHQNACHAFFMLALLGVGLATCAAFFVGSSYWLLSAATLACMVLMAICDFDRANRPATI